MSTLRAGLFLCAFAIHASMVFGHPITRAAHEASLDAHETRTLIASATLRTAAARTPPVAVETCQLTIRLVDARTRSPIDGLVRITRADGGVVPLEGLVNRGIKRSVGKFVHALRQRINEMHRLGLLHPIQPTTPVMPATVLKPNPATLKARR